MYYELFNEVFWDNENAICIFEIGAFYIVLNEQAAYLSELLGLKKVCFAPGICKVGFPKTSLTKYVKKLRDLSISFVVLDACNMDSSADYIYELKGFKKKYEFVDERFIFNKSNYICDCNKCSFKKTEIMKELYNCRRILASLTSEMSNLAIMQDISVKCDFDINEKEYEELMICGNINNNIFLLVLFYRELMFTFSLTSYYSRDILLLVVNYMKSLMLDENVQYLKGVGPTRAKHFEKLGIHTIYDLLTHFPREYEDRNNIKKIEDFVAGENVVFVASICTRPQMMRRGRGFSLTNFYVSDGTGRVQIAIFNQSYKNEKLEVDKEFAFYGKVDDNKGRLEIVNPVMIEVENIAKIKGLYPIYPLTAGLKNGNLAKIISELLDKKYALPEVLSTDLRKKYGLCEINYAIEQIHRPSSLSAISEARKRLIFEELFMLQLALLVMRNQNFSEKKGISFKDTSYDEFLEILPFELTSAQTRVLGEIMKDMASDRSMNRLVQGDVGSGKTIVAAIAMYVAVKNGYQTALMAPTTILAKQHYEELKKYFAKFNMTVELLTGSTTKKNKDIILEKLKAGQIDVLIGTNALVTDNVEFKNAGLIITDEQHRFGVKQRMKLNAKGDNADVLVMTATPIPRTLALMVYSDLDMSIIDELPKGRIPIKTYVVNEKLEERVDNFIKKEIDKGRQAYIVCPLIEENEELDLTDATNLYERYKNEVFPEYEVGFLHGKMKKKEKEEIMESFKSGKTQIIISTTVIEVGVNVPNATLMIIEDADRFGLATLHQLRGRVGRSTFESYCVLKTKNFSQKCRERLGIMVKSNNGFEIAEKDLELRGPGDFFGIRQHGLPEFKLANLLTDVKLLKLSNDAAKEVLTHDPEFKLPENKILKQELFGRYNEQLLNIGT